MVEDRGSQMKEKHFIVSPTTMTRRSIFRFLLGLAAPPGSAYRYPAYGARLAGQAAAFAGLVANCIPPATSSSEEPARFVAATSAG